MRPIASALVVAFLVIGAAATPALAEDQTTRLVMDAVPLDGAPAQTFSGTVRVRTPAPPAFVRFSDDGAPTAQFIVPLRTLCRADVPVNTRVVRTRRSPRRQVYAATDGDDGTLVKDWRPRSPWRLTEEPAAGGISLFGIRVIKVAPRRFLHVRVFAYFDATCPDVDRREGVVPDGLAKILRSARVRGSLGRS